MRKLLSQFQGDKAIWAYVILLALFSFMPVFSASTNLVHVVGTGSIIGLLFKHFAHIFVGIVIIFFVHRIPFDRLKFIAPLAWIPVTALLIITAAQGMMIGGAMQAGGSNSVVKHIFSAFVFRMDCINCLCFMVFVALC